MASSPIPTPAGEAGSSNANNGSAPPELARRGSNSTSISDTSTLINPLHSGASSAASSISWTSGSNPFPPLVEGLEQESSRAQQSRSQYYGGLRPSHPRHGSTSTNASTSSSSRRSQRQDLFGGIDPFSSAASPAQHQHSAASSSQLAVSPAQAGGKPHHHGHSKKQRRHHRHQHHRDARHPIDAPLSGPGSSRRPPPLPLARPVPRRSNSGNTRTISDASPGGGWFSGLLDLLSFNSTDRPATNAYAPVPMRSVGQPSPLRSRFPGRSRSFRRSGPAAGGEEAIYESNASSYDEEKDNYDGATGERPATFQRGASTSSSSYALPTLSYSPALSATAGGGNRTSTSTDCHRCGASIRLYPSAADDLDEEEEDQLAEKGHLLGRRAPTSHGAFRWRGIGFGRSSEEPESSSSSQNHGRYSGTRRSARDGCREPSRIRSLLQICSVLIPTFAACLLSFVLGISFEALRASITDASGSIGPHRYGGGRGGGGWRQHRPWMHGRPGLDGPQGPDGGPGAHGHRWKIHHGPPGSGRPGSWYEAATGCSAGDLALARLTPPEPIRVHSHNDETRARPLTEALSYGALSVEADVWLMPGDETVSVGHEIESLSDRATFQAFYIDPLVKILEKRNVAFVHHGDPAAAAESTVIPAGGSHPAASSTTGRSWNGVYESAPNQTLYLFLDIKSESLATWAAVNKALEPLRSRGWLTRWTEGKELIQGPITVIGTGDVPVAHVAPMRNRDVFVDAPIAEIHRQITGSDGQQYAYNATLSPVASGNWLMAIGYMGLFPASRTTRSLVRGMNEAAHERGILTRWWGNPAWPVFARDRAWRLMLDEGVDFLNADDLEGAADTLVDSAQPKHLRSFQHS